VNAARMMRGPIGWALLLIVVVLACASVFAVVPETQQAVVVRLGAPRAVVNLYRAGEGLGQTGAGLIARVPLLDQIVFVDKRVQTLDAPNMALASADGQRFTADAYAQYRVVDPARFYLAAGGENGRLADVLKPAIGRALRDTLGKLPAARLLAPDQAPELRDAVARVDGEARRFGVQVTAIRLDRIALPEGDPLDSALGRMRADRGQQAARIRADGDRDVKAIRTDADARASQIYADAFGQDPEFYDFYRAMQSYRGTMGDGSARIVLSPDSQYLHQFRTGGKQ
jgi:modulator of FtsH protease HflC